MKPFVAIAIVVVGSAINPALADSLILKGAHITSIQVDVCSPTTSGLRRTSAAHNVLLAKVLELNTLVRAKISPLNKKRLKQCIPFLLRGN